MDEFDDWLKKVESVRELGKMQKDNSEFTFYKSAQMTLYKKMYSNAKTEAEKDLIKIKCLNYLDEAWHSGYQRGLTLFVLGVSVSLGLIAPLISTSLSRLLELQNNFYLDLGILALGLVGVIFVWFKLRKAYLRE